jgi:hypothetical protein
MNLVLFDRASGSRARILRIGTPAAQPSPLKGKNRAVMLRGGRFSDAHRSHRFVNVQVPKRPGNLHTPRGQAGVGRGRGTG